MKRKSHNILLIAKKIFSHSFLRSGQLPYSFILFTFFQFTSIHNVVGYQEKYGSSGVQQHQQRHESNIIQPSMHSFCHEEWQWECEEEKECIAKYDLCDGIAQCSDASDESEKNCRHYRFLQQTHQAAPAATSHATIKPSTTSTPPVNKPMENQQSKLPIEHLLLVLAIFVIIAGIIHTIIKRRKNRFNSSGIRGFRKGESLVEDEDDLLISQMYT